MAAVAVGVRWATIEHRQGREDHSEHLSDPGWEQIEEGILALDGKSRTIVGMMISPDPEQYMTISGRWGGRAKVEATPDNRQFFILLDATRADRKVLVYVGGQDVEFRENWLVPLDWALEAARHYFEAGELKSGLNWVRR